MSSIKGFVVSGLIGLAGLALFLPTQGCGSSTGASGERICTPGANVFCRCADRSQGTKLCADDGKSFSTPCSTDESRTVCAGGEIDDPDTGKPVDGDGNPIDNPDPVDSGTTPTSACPGKPLSLTPGVEAVVDGDTTGGKDNTKGTSTCSTGGGGNDQIYEITPTGSGRVDFTVKGEGAMNPVAYIRTSCDDELSQVRCAPPLGAGGNLVFQQNMVANTKYYLVVDGASGSAGKYRITAKLTTMPFCGDGKVSDGEACDDINKTDNDGCDPSCTKVNGNPAAGGSCPGHQVDLWSGKTVTGTGSNNAAGYANTFGGTSVACDTAGTNNITDHVYQINPHADGILTISLTSSFNHNIVVRKNSCTDDASTTAALCKDKTQSINTLVTAGTPVWVAVDGGSNSNNVGDYTITFKHTLQ